MDIAMAMAMRHGWRIVRYLPGECGFELGRRRGLATILVTVEGIITAYATRRDPEGEDERWIGNNYTG